MEMNKEREELLILLVPLFLNTKVQLIKMRLEVLSDCYSGYRFCAEVKLKL